MMEFDELAIMAFGGNHPPDGANTIELAAYRGLCYCYDAYRQGVISHDAASRKNESLRRHTKPTARCMRCTQRARNANEPWRA